MKKSVYSLVLSDDVVTAADKAATKRGLSRSALINEVLAASRFNYAGKIAYTV